MTVLPMNDDVYMVQAYAIGRGINRTGREKRDTRRRAQEALIMRYPPARKATSVTPWRQVSGCSTNAGQSLLAA